MSAPTGPDAPYPEPKATHTMARTGRPWTDRKPPAAAPIWDVIEGFGRYHVLVSALQLGVFEALVPAGASAHAVAERLGASEPHVRALLDALAAMGFLEAKAEIYALNDLARRYLTQAGAASMVDLIPVAPGPLANWSQLTDTVRRGAPATPIDDDPAAFYRPLVAGTFTTILRCATRADCQLRYSALPAPVVLDLGAGRAPWSIAVLTANPTASAVVNDLPAVLGDAADALAAHGVAERATLRPGDAHAVELEAARYDLVVLGHVCRAESVDGARHLIARAHGALRPGGRLVLSDYFVDRVPSAEPHAAMMNVTMMASTRHGACRSAGEHATWLRAAGFDAVRLIEPIGFQQVLVARRPPHMEASP